ncbi:acyl-CoA-binding domain-containing protein 5 isoform X2 [Chelonus insularis]|nr:acyl-CoA-binding domain-containing protein 5 isoform X2 [Chelonus insularis]
MRLGNMSRNEAMNNYVEELKKIVETMSYTDNVANFLGSLDSFYESVPVEDLEMLVGPVIERMRSQPGSPLSASPLGSRETSPQRVRNPSRHITSSLETSPASSHSASPLPPDTDGEEEEFKDTLESAPEKSIKEPTKSSISAQSNTKSSGDQIKPEISTNLTNGHSNSNKNEINADKHHQDRGRVREKKNGKENNYQNSEFLQQVTETLRHLQRDLDRITGRVRSLEGQALQSLTPKSDCSRIYPRWWPLSDCSPRIFAVIILWPFIAQLIINLMKRRQRKM